MKTTTTTTKTLHVPREIQQQTWVMNNKLSPGCDQMGTVRTKQCAQSHIPTSVHTCIYLSIYLSIYQYIYIYININIYLFKGSWEAMFRITDDFYSMKGGVRVYITSQFEV